MTSEILTQGNAQLTEAQKDRRKIWDTRLSELEYRGFKFDKPEQDSLKILSFRVEENIGLNDMKPDGDEEGRKVTTIFDVLDVHGVTDDINLEEEIITQRVGAVIQRESLRKNPLFTEPTMNPSQEKLIFGKWLAEHGELEK